jgi:L-cystine uptake protein TcyP (sodium:dicarboxylate symporter family)
MDKIVGWILLLIGLAIIFLGVYYSYNIFIGKSEVPDIFPSEIVLENEKIDNNTSDQDLENQAELLIDEKLSEMIPANSFPALLNLVAWSVFVGILIFAGGQVAGIGVKLIKK